MLGTLFFRLRASCEHLNRMIDAVKIRVCSVVNTGLADCLLVAIQLCRLRDADRVHACEPVPNPTGELRGILGRHREVVRSGYGEVFSDQAYSKGIHQSAHHNRQSSVIHLSGLRCGHVNSLWQPRHLKTVGPSLLLSSALLRDATTFRVL